MTQYGRLPTLNEQEILLAIYTGRMAGRPPANAALKLVERGFLKAQLDKDGRYQLTQVAFELVKFCINLGLMSSAATRQSMPPDVPAVPIRPPDDPITGRLLQSIGPVRAPPPLPVTPKPLLDTPAMMAIPPTKMNGNGKSNGYAPEAKPPEVRPPESKPAPKPKGPPAKFVLTPLMRQMMAKRK
jgi:hypothetical protein